MRFKFMGESDSTFELTHGKTYEFIQFINNKYLYAFFVNNDKNIVAIPYSNLITFNRNWYPIEGGN